MRLASEITRSPTFPPSVGMTRFFSILLEIHLRCQQGPLHKSELTPFFERRVRGGLEG
jgi:hypothetical protein